MQRCSHRVRKGWKEAWGIEPHLASMTDASTPAAFSCSAAARQVCTMVPYPTSATSVPFRRITPFPICTDRFRESVMCSLHPTYRYTFKG